MLPHTFHLLVHFRSHTTIYSIMISNTKMQGKVKIAIKKQSFKRFNSKAKRTFYSKGKYAASL
jgi:hypothetical protein